MLDEIVKNLGDKITAFSQEGYMATLLTSKSHAKEIVQYLKEKKFNILTDLSAVDYPDREERFEIIYNLLNIFDNQRVIIKFGLKDQEELESIADVFNAAIWYEREVWDMFGVYFTNHPDLRRILTDYGFEGNPLRKDFPLTGFKEVHYDESQKKVIYSPVKLAQDYRNFDFLSPWERPNYVLPGDEKAEKKL